MKTFGELELIAPVQRALADLCYQTPTPIQAKAVPPAISGRDVLGCAQTGTGKTAAFALPILHRLGQRNCKAASNRPLALVLAPTRELTIQIGESFASYGKRLPLRQALVYGGVSQLKQVFALNKGAHILVATPGRLLDLMQQGHVSLQQLEVFVLDEVDRMLDMGFLPDLKRIIKRLPDRRQSLFFSATLPANIMALSKSLLSDPVNVNVTPKSPSVETIQQRVVFVERPEKQGQLLRILNSGEAGRTLVFTGTKRRADNVVEKLVRKGIRAVAIHGNKSQNARQRALTAFQRNQVQVLVATDVAARGIDIDGVTHVINFDLPGNPESYVHRIGRTGRAGGAGVALSFCTQTERNELRAIEKLIGKSLEPAADHPVTPKRAAKAANGSVAQQLPSGKLNLASRSLAGESHTNAVKPKRKRRRRGRNSSHARQAR